MCHANSRQPTSDRNVSTSLPLRRAACQIVCGLISPKRRCGERRDVAGFVADAKRKIARAVALPPGTYVGFAGSAEAQARARRDLLVYSGLAGLGIVLLLFVIGLELRPARLWQLRQDIFGLGLAQVALCGLALTGVLLLLTGLSWEAALVVGLPLALSSTALVVGLLQERGAMNTPKGERTFAILLFQDLALVPLLGAIVLTYGLVADAATVTSNTFEMAWPPRSGRTQMFPEVDRAQWCSPDVARVKLNPAQAQFIDRLEDLLSPDGT